MCIWLKTLAACLWLVAVADIWGAFPGRVMSVDFAAAVTASVIAAICRLSEHRRADGENAAVLADGIELLARTLANVTRPDGETRKTVPLRRVQ